MARSLPQGRGYRRGENAYVNQQESFATRAQALPLADQFILQPNVTSLPASSQNFSGQIFVPLGFYEKSIRIAEARVYITVVGGTTLTAQLYVLISTGEIRQQPGTKVTFDISTTGLKQESLASILPAGQRYFLGVEKPSGGQIMGFGGGSNQSLEQLHTNASTSGLSSTLNLNSITKASVNFIPNIQYYSRDAAQVL